MKTTKSSKDTAFMTFLATCRLLRLREEALEKWVQELRCWITSPPGTKWRISQDGLIIRFRGRSRRVFTLLEGVCHMLRPTCHNSILMS